MIIINYILRNSVAILIYLPIGPFLCQFIVFTVQLPHRNTFRINDRDATALVPFVFVFFSSQSRMSCCHHFVGYCFTCKLKKFDVKRKK